MSLGCLAELVSVTNDAVKSLNKSGSIGTSDKMRFFSAGSPFESPQSFKSASDKSDHHRDALMVTGMLSPKAKFYENTDANQTDDVQIVGNNVHLAEEDLEKLTITETNSCKIVSGSASGNQQSHNYAENTNSSINQKVSISKKHLREIISPREEALDHAPDPSLSKSSKESSNSWINKGHFISKVSSSKGKFFIERHEPNIHSTNINNNWTASGKNEKQLIDSSSSFSDQLEIIDVPENVVAITSGISQTSDDSVKVMYNKAPIKSSRNRSSIDGQITGKIEHGHGLKQGALNKGFVDPSKNSLFSDVYISQFGLTEKQRGLKEALAKRSESGMPKKKFVQPQIIQKKVMRDGDTDRSTTNSQSDAARAVTSAADPVVTAAAAASAAVAAAQPFLKTQHELETRMQQLLAQLAELQGKAGGVAIEKKPEASDNRIFDLERQVAELSERRFEHLENLQQQQMEMQAQLLFMAQARSHNSWGNQTNRQTSSARQLHNSRIPQAVVNQPGLASQKAYNHSTHNQLLYNPTTHSQPSYNLATHSQPLYNPAAHSQPIFNPAVLSKHHNYLNEVRELQGSHLDTPAPRDRVPKPTPYTLPKEPQKNLGFLQELLDRRDNSDRDTTFSVKGDYSSPTRLDSDRSSKPQ